MSYLRKVGAWLVCGLIAGLLLGIGARLVMRAIAVAEHQTPAFSPEATAGILSVGVIIGLLSAALFVPFRAYTPGAGAWKGSLFGALLLLLLIPFLPPTIKDEIAISSDRGLLPAVVGSFGALFVLFGVILQTLDAWLLSRASRRVLAHGE